MTLSEWPPPFGGRGAFSEFSVFSALCVFEFTRLLNKFSSLLKEVKCGFVVFLFCDVRVRSSVIGHFRFFPLSEHGEPIHETSNLNTFSIRYLEIFTFASCQNACFYCANTFFCAYNAIFFPISFAKSIYIYLPWQPKCKYFFLHRKNNR